MVDIITYQKLNAHANWQLDCLKCHQKKPICRKKPTYQKSQLFQEEKMVK
jgi:hypothetical protein